VLDVERLSVSYGAVQALRDVSFRVEDNSITTVLGANGAGKTTLLRALSGLVKPSSGAVRDDGAEITGRPVEEIVRRGISHVPEGRGVIQELTVEENLRLGGLWRHRGAALSAAIADVYELFPALTRLKRRTAASLSGGERQMLAVGRALVGRPRVLLLDEPSLGLAPLVTADLMKALSSLVATTRLTVLLVEQNARMALSIAKWAVVLNIGEVVVNSPAEIVGADADLRHHYLGF
jgi:branched-chain amino acid transport system ATP-binding protein